VINLHVEHTRAGIERAAVAFRRLIDVALDFGGGFYLTYHRWAKRRQLERAYPQLPAFVDAKLAHDPGERFQSDWYRWLRAALAAKEAA
jgi:hypothetical protein